MLRVMEAGEKLRNEFMCESSAGEGQCRLDCQALAFLFYIVNYHILTRAGRSLLLWY